MADKWLRMDESPSDMAQRGLPKSGDVVRVTYLKSPLNGKVVRVIDDSTNKAFKARQHGPSFLASGLV